ncbi:MAG: C40 family peptidase [Myxococcaceae bacterium]|nr:C40 family peptidase [Myxococcaceae bacterium]
MRFVVLVAMLSCACASVLVRDDAALSPPPLVEAPDDLGLRIARHADALVGIHSLRTVTKLPDDCTGLVRFAYAQEGVELMPLRGTRGTNGVTAIWVSAREKNALHVHAPRVGDLAFFRETYDRDRDGRTDDGLTHVALVDSIDADGTVHFIHRSGRGVTRERMNPDRPRDKAVNDWLRMRSSRAPAALSGELFVGYASWPELFAQ